MAGKKRKGKKSKGNRQDQQQEANEPQMIAGPSAFNQADPAIKARDGDGKNQREMPKSNWAKHWRQLCASAVAIATVVAGWAALEMRNAANETLERSKIEQIPQLDF